MQLLTVWATVLFCAALAACGPGEHQQAPTQQSLIEFADAFDRAQLTKDGRALEKMVADDLVFIDGSGKRYGKKEFIEGWTAPGDQFDPITLIDRVVVRIGNDGGVVSAETVLSGISGGERFSSHFRFSDTFRWEQNQWRAAHIQVTRVPS